MQPLAQPMSPPRHRSARPLRPAGLPAAWRLGTWPLSTWRLSTCLLVAGTWCTAWSGTAQAGPLADPTRPPSATANPAGNTDTGPVRGRDGRATAPAGRPAAVAAPLPVLQSVRVPASGPAMAMIDGQMVKAGDTVGGRLVQAIDRLGITLAGRPAPERVLLLSGAPKQPPGSIATTHATRYEPAAADATDTPPRGDRPGLAMPSPTTPVPLSVAGRTAP